MLDLAIRAARQAGAVLAQAYGQPHQIIVKGVRDITTEADLAAEKAALGLIREGCPEARIVSEESSYQFGEHDDRPTWYVDPLDGTTNFARGLPMFCVSVGMARQGRVECGVVFDPIRDQLFYAERGQGAYLNDKRLHVSEQHALIDCVVMLDWPRNQEIRALCATFASRLSARVDAVRCCGSAALGLCAVAAGWVDAYMQYTLKPWDVAAGIVIIEEAGGRLSDLRGSPYDLHQGDWLASNQLAHESILALKPFEAT